MKDPAVLVEEYDEKRVEDNHNVCLLPKIVRGLIEKRKGVKRDIKSARDEDEKEALDIKQLAIKLIANSIYGCLGFTNSRFYARDIASMITFYGRKILE